MSKSSTLSIDGPSTLRGALLFLLVGLAATGYGAYDYVQQSDAVENAVEVDAEIVETGVESSSTNRRSGVDYKPDVQFSYRYEGTSYTGTNIYPASTTPSYDTESAARSALDGYEPGEMVTAYVDPADPADAFLKNQTSNAPLLIVAMGLFFSVAGGVSSVRKYRSG